MSAFLVLIALVVGPGGLTQIEIKLPWQSLESCQEYLASPLPIPADFGNIKIHIFPDGTPAMKAVCEPVVVSQIWDRNKPSA